MNFNFDGVGKPNAFKEAIKGMKDEMENYVEFLQIKAKLEKIHYDELIKNGFSKEDALKICHNIF